MSWAVVLFKGPNCLYCTSQEGIWKLKIGRIKTLQDSKGMFHGMISQFISDRPQISNQWLELQHKANLWTFAGCIRIFLQESRGYKSLLLKSWYLSTIRGSEIVLYEPTAQPSNATVLGSSHELQVQRGLFVSIDSLYISFQHLSRECHIPAKS